MDKKHHPKGSPRGTSAEEEKQAKELTRLSTTWVIWEQTSGTGRMTEKEYEENLHQIGEFSDLITFFQIWKTLPHSTPSNLFTSSDSPGGALFNKMFIQQGDYKKVIGIFIFQKGIKPGWEDPKNKPGGSFSTTKRGCSNEEYNQAWEKLVYYIIGGSEYSSNICGIRIVDKPFAPDSCLKYELWVDFKEKGNDDKVASLTEALAGICNSHVSYAPHYKIGQLNSIS